MALTLDAINGRKRPVHEIGPVPVFDTTAYVREITVGERNEWAAPILQASLNKDADVARPFIDRRINLVFVALSDKDGNRLCTNVQQVRDMPTDAVDYIAQQIERINGLTEEGRAEIAGNSTATEEGSGSSS